MSERLTKEQVQSSNTFHYGNCTLNTGLRGKRYVQSIVYRKNGTMQEWKREPSKYKQPIKNGLYSHSYITEGYSKPWENNSLLFHTVEQCPCNAELLLELPDMDGTMKYRAVITGAVWNGSIEDSRLCLQLWNRLDNTKLYETSDIKPGLSAFMEWGKGDLNRALAEGVELVLCSTPQNEETADLLAEPYQLYELWYSILQDRVKGY